MSTVRPPRSLSPELWVCQLGTIPYRRAVTIQERVRERRLAGELPDTLLLLEHPPIYTRGRRSAAGELPLGESFYREQGVEVIDSDRGGRITYHGPGQLVGYPIMAVLDVHRYLRTMEEAIIAALAQAHVEARSRREEGVDYTGVWVEDRKIASIGLHVSRGITTHGFAVNVENDLQPFSWVIACGLPDVAMTSIAVERRRMDPRHADCDSAALTVAGASSISCFRKEMAHRFCLAHGRRQRLVSPRRLGIDIANPSGLAERAPINISQPPRETIPA